MAVSKRLRFEVLRRDNHACRYCGRIAPEVTITVDHVVPVALGGSDDPSNLVAACKDCNAGKSSVPAGAPLIGDVAQDAIRWADAMQANFARALAELSVRNEYLRSFFDTWDSWRYGFNDKFSYSLPSDWEASVAKWYALGLPIEILHDATNTAMRKRNLTGPDAEFRYMAGVVWGKLTEIQQQTAAMMAAPSDLEHDEVHCPWGCRVHPDEDGNEPEACPKCGRLGCPWACGHIEGEMAGYNTGWDAGQKRVWEWTRWEVDSHWALREAVEGPYVREFIASLPPAPAPF